MKKSEHGSGPHLGQAQLQALADGRAGEWVRQAAAAHLSECDACLEQYLAILEQEPLLAPAASPAAAAAQATARRKNRKAKRMRVATVLAAACIAVVVWGGGALHFYKSPPGTPQSPTLAQELDKAAGSVADAFNGFFGAIGESLAQHRPLPAKG